MNPRTPAVALLMGVSLSTLTGCVGAFFRQPVNVEATRAEVEASRREQVELQAQLRDLRARTDALSEAVLALRADSNNQLRAIEDQLQILQARLEEQGFRFEQIQRRSRDRSPGLPAPPDTAGAAPPEPGPGPPSSVSTAGLFEAAHRDFSRGNYQLAIAGFQEFLKAEPRSERADNAQYWVAESYYSLGQMDRSIQEFLKVRDLYPEGDMMCAATLKIGYAFVRKGDTPAARRYFETVIRECPGSDEEKLARDKLESLR